jgi:hypothetical protein
MKLRIAHGVGNLTKIYILNKKKLVAVAVGAPLI